MALAFTRYALGPTGKATEAEISARLRHLKEYAAETGTTVKAIVESGEYPQDAP